MVVGVLVVADGELLLLALFDAEDASDGTTVAGEVDSLDEDDDDPSVWGASVVSSSDEDASDVVSEERSLAVVAVGAVVDDEVVSLPVERLAAVPSSTLDTPPSAVIR